MGTAMTGNVVSAAMTPARCAAPPAPAMMTLMPRVGSALREFAGAARRTVRRSDVDLVGDAEFVERLGGLVHDFEVGVAAHHDGNKWMLAHGAHFPSQRVPEISCDYFAACCFNPRAAMS